MSYGSPIGNQGYPDPTNYDDDSPGSDPGYYYIRWMWTWITLIVIIGGISVGLHFLPRLWGIDLSQYFK